MAAVESMPPNQTVARLFEHAPCGYLATLPDGAIVQVNDTFRAMSGVARDWLLARRRFAELLTVPGKIYLDTHVGPLLEMQGFVREVAFDLVRSDGHRLPVIVNAVREPAGGAGERDHGGPALTLVTIFDATDRRQYEKELLLAKRRAEEATAAERAARRQAEEAARTKDEFLALVSHELRTPLNAIVGWAQMLQAAAGIADEQREGLAVIQRNAQVQAELINDLLDMSRLITGKMRLNVQDVRLADVIEDALDTARPAADAKGLRLQRVLTPGVVVSGDPGRLQQVFWRRARARIEPRQRGHGARYSRFLCPRTLAS